MEEDDGAAAAAIASLWDGRWIVNDKRKGFVVSVIFFLCNVEIFPLFI